jgi:polyhydroxyalkanoate synthesis regulator phasin
MFKEVRKGLMAGIGAVVLTREKVEEITRRLVDEAKMTEDDARRLTDELIESGENQFGKIEKAFTDAFQTSMDRVGIGRQEAFQRLRDKVDALEIRLSILEKAHEARQDR